MEVLRHPWVVPAHLPDDPSQARFTVQDLVFVTIVNVQMDIPVQAWDDVAELFINAFLRYLRQRLLTTLPRAHTIV